MRLRINLNATKNHFQWETFSMQLRIICNAIENHLQLGVKNDSQWDRFSFSMRMTIILNANDYHPHPHTLCDFFTTLVQNCNNLVSHRQHCDIIATLGVHLLFHLCSNPEQNWNKAGTCDNIATSLRLRLILNNVEPPGVGNIKLVLFVHFLGR